MFSSKEIREKFLRYFDSRGHRRIKSSPLIPADDPTLLFANAGMNQFKDYFTGTRKPPVPRATTCQKCVRAGGKHNDLENVGVTARHHTFFEMLGNFSFGDYFKREACQFAWEFVTGELRLDAERTWVTVFRDDDEAFIIWRDLVGVPERRIVRMGEKDNFWAMGDTGPCGPCSEILYDQGDGPGGVWKGQDIFSDSDRFLEIWNLVFMQFERRADGRMIELPKPSIDTGAGLERITAICNGAFSNYDTDAFMPIIESVAKTAGIAYKSDPKADVSLRVIADHARAAAFLISDNIFPSNDGRGYVLRRIMRRAIRHGKRLGLENPFFADAADKVIENMGCVYPELKENRDSVLSWTDTEEKSFRQTLDRGLKTLSDEISRVKKAGGVSISGEFAFKLYDQDGFPPDLTAVIAAEDGAAVDSEGFEREMEKQRNRGRASWKGGDAELEELFKRLRDKCGATTFTGYENNEDEAKVLAVVRVNDANGGGVSYEETDCAQTGQKIFFITDKTPFYGESGGQVGDVGGATFNGTEAEITDTRKPFIDFHAHEGVVKSGCLKIGSKIKLSINAERREQIRAHHSATHALHYALRAVLGTHVKQAGSYVAPDRLRFDFNHFKAVSADELEKIERVANELTRGAHQVSTVVVTPDEAKDAGALMFFGEKYGEKVRMVSMGPSKELCGGTHTSNTGKIGSIRILSETAIASGVRRIEAVVAAAATEHSLWQNAQLAKLAGALHVSAADVPARVEKLMEEIKDAEKKFKTLQTEMARKSAGSLEDKARKIDGITLLATTLDGADMTALRDLSTEARDKLGALSVVVLASSVGADKAFVSVAVGADLAGKRFHAGKMVSALAPLIGGKGGGKPDAAQGGGSNPGGIEALLAEAEKLAQK